MYGGKGDRRQCGGCKWWVSRANYARHVRACGRVEVGGGGCWGRDVGLGLGGGQVRMVTCGGCEREMRAGNLARHQRGACRVWDPGEGANPLTGVDGPVDGWMVIREAGIHWTEVERLTSDRKGGRKGWRREWSIWTGGKDRMGMGISGNRESRDW